MIEQAEIEVGRNILKPMEPHDGAVPLGFHQLDGLILVELIIDGLNPFQGLAGIFMGKQDDPLHIAQLFPSRGFKADLEGYLVVFELTSWHFRTSG